MSSEDVKAILDRVLTWPPERQQDAVEMLLMMEASDASAYRLTHDQIAEVRRRRDDPDAETLTLEEFTARLQQRIAARPQEMM
ncbi:hypothetical protein HNR60_002262 [Rhodopseudomonas rhenobacensis]|uniref:Uncharacterized protein n=1 Tax=Rhodopseudomonas rhenobacensis TaxID=87461 RepID=A0A7W7Z486_9BRAD|nr:hypothetical protein [Rhodopseudomonas rhenobacensis]MBB5047505.1 hypothetical protein [Rhodopseudomonas rhenobacensis]